MSDTAGSSSSDPSGPPPDPLNPNALLNRLVEILPRPSNAESSQSVIKSPVELTMALFYAALLNLGFRFLGLGEERVDSQALEGQEGDQIPATPLPQDWNAAGDMFSFRYKHPQSAFIFLLKGVKVGDKLIVHGMAIEDGKLHTFELVPSTFVSPNFGFPVTPAALEAPNPLTSAFASEEQLYEVIREFRVHIVQQLIPGLNKPGYEEWKKSENESRGSSSSHQPRQPPHFHPIHPAHDPYAGGIPETGPMYPPRGPYSVGDVDLDPLAIAPGLIPPGHFGPRSPLGSGMHPGGGMFVGPEHPMFTGGGGGFGGGVPRPGPLAGPGGQRLPPGAVPPGARFDPIMPFGQPPPGPGPRGPFGPGTGGGGGPGAFSGEPDPDELPPPNYDTMFM